MPSMPRHLRRTPSPETIDPEIYRKLSQIHRLGIVRAVEGVGDNFEVNKTKFTHKDSNAGWEKSTAARPTRSASPPNTGPHRDSAETSVRRASSSHL